MSIEIKVSMGVLAWLVIALFSMAASVYIYQQDSSASYTWVTPLNSPQSIHLYFKQGTGLALVDVARGSETITISTGAPSTLTLAPSPSSYAVVVAKGASIYVEAVNIVNTAVVLASAWVISRRMSGLRLALSLTVIAMLVALVSASSLLYIGTGFTTGYTAVDKRLYAQFSQLEYITLENQTYNYSYVLRDSFRDAALVNISIELRDPYIPVVLVRVNGSQGAQDIPLSTIISPGGGPITYAWTFYTANSNLTIYVLSQGKLENSTITYYKVEFQRKGDPPTLPVTLLPLISLAASTTACILLVKKTPVQREGGTR